LNKQKPPFAFAICFAKELIENPILPVCFFSCVSMSAAPVSISGAPAKPVKVTPAIDPAWLSQAQLATEDVPELSVESLQIDAEPFKGKLVPADPAADERNQQILNKYREVCDSLDLFSVMLT
jgi:hypothetical protein